jgi:hypothetical protein
MPANDSLKMPSKYADRSAIKSFKAYRMLTEPIPIEIYVGHRFKDKTILAIIENWRIEPEALEKAIVTYFREMGIFSVTPKLDSTVKHSITHLLLNSPEIFGKVRKAEQQEAMRRQNKRADAK